MFIRYNIFFINTSRYYYSTKHTKSQLLTRLSYKQHIGKVQTDSKQLTNRAQKILQSRWKDWIHHSKARRISTILGLNTEQYFQLADSFVKSCEKGQLTSCQPSNLVSNVNHSFMSYQELENHIDDKLLTAFFEYAYPYLPGFIQQIKKSSQFSTVTWFPQTQSSRRAIYIHTIDPSQFIKLYHEVLKTSTVMYCGQQPINNNQDEKNNKMIITNITDYLDNPSFKHNKVSTFILDNIEKSTNQHDGWRWTNALFHISSSSSSNLHILLNDDYQQHSLMSLLLSIFKENDQECIVQQYTKSYRPHLDVVHLIQDKFQPKDCIIIKNRHELFQIKDVIENNFGLKCAILYSELPHAIQLNQIKLYDESKKDVLLITENMELPFKINVDRLVFKTIKKNQGEAHLTINKLQQMISSFGVIKEIGCYRNTDIKCLQEAVTKISLQPVEKKAVGVLPPKDVFKKFHQLFSEDQSMASIMVVFKIMTNVHGKYFMCDWKDQLMIADCIEHIPLTFEDRWEFINAPVNTKLPITIPTLQLFGESVAYKKKCDLKEIMPTLLQNQSTIKALDHLVHQYHRIEWYHWFKLKYPSIFISDDNLIITLQHKYQTAIENTLDIMKPKLSWSKNIQKQSIEKVYLQVEQLIRQY